MKFSPVVYSYLSICRYLAIVSCFLLQASAVQASDKLGVAVPYLPKKISLSNYEEPITRIILANIAYGATRVGRASVIEHEAAAELEALEQGQIWHLHLRPNLHFANGSALIAADALKAYSILSRYDQALRNDSAPYHVTLEEVRPSGPKIKLRFELSEADSNFPARLARLPLFQPELFSVFGESFGEGTNVGFLGPYRIRRHNGSSLVLEATEDFYRPGLPRTRLIEFRVYDSAAEALSSLRVGATDIIALPTERILSDASTDETLAILKSPLHNSAPTQHGWVLLQEQWGENNNLPADRLTTKQLVIRKTLQIDDSLLARFDLTGTYLP